MAPNRATISLLVGFTVIGAVMLLLSSFPSAPFQPTAKVPQSQEPKGAGSSAASSLGARGPAASAAKGWTPPEGDPVARYRESKGAPAQVRKDLISNFMALGHDRNPYLLIEALSDPDPGVRLFAVESASALTVGEATAVLAASSSNPDPDVREMTWSLTAPYPVESKVTIFSGVLRRGDETMMREAFQEMGIRPEKPLFEMMLTEAVRPGVETSRQGLLMQELKAWLVPGGGNVPDFPSALAMAEWWKSNLANYDGYLLRIDINP